MHINRAIIKGFRNFKDASIPLKEGINVIIGHNNSGKSNLIHAIAHTLNVEGIGRHFDINDLFRETDLEILKEHSPQLSISLILKQSDGEPLDIIRKSEENERITQAIEKSEWSQEDKKRALFAARYLNSVGKGSNALTLCAILEENLKKGDTDPTKESFNVPEYIKQTFEWLLQ